MALNKEFKHGNYNFNIKVELDSQIGMINGKKFHTITCNCMDAWNYYDKRNVETQILFETILEMENKARYEADLRDDKKTDLEKELIELGFK